MSKKTKIIFACLFLTILVLLLSLKIIGYHCKEDKGIIGFCGRLLNKTNDFSFAIKNIDKQDVDIVWHSNNYSDTLVRNGVLINNFGYDYGPILFTVFYKNDSLCTDGFFSLNNNNPHRVKIDILKISNGINVFFDFDNEKTEKAFDLKGLRLD